MVCKEIFKVYVIIKFLEHSIYYQDYANSLTNTITTINYLLPTYLG